ncbi:MAG: acyl-CoA thioesterase [Clostridia bacterium]|nr:acyl-CoA thioesterase [Clostridia bacterium]
MDKIKTPSQSQLEMTEMVIPNDTNMLGNLLGGRMMHWLDIAGAIVASRHSNSTVVTVAVDSLEFKHPVKLGEVVILEAKMVWTGRTSMAVKVDAFSEDLKEGKKRHTNSAYLTFVALDDEGSPTPVPHLEPETEEEKREFRLFEQRRNCVTVKDSKGDE